MFNKKIKSSNCQFDYWNKPIQLNVNYNKKNSVFSIISTSGNSNIKSINNNSGFSLGPQTNRAYITHNNKICDWNDATKSFARFNLLEQSIQFDINPIKTARGQNVSIYLTPMTGNKDDNYCDIHQSICLELDLIEANCNGIQLTVHSPTDVSSGGKCGTDGCYVSAIQKPDICNLLNDNSGWITVKTTFDKDGTMNVYLNNTLYFEGKQQLTENAKSDIVKIMKSTGVVVIASLWGNNNKGDSPTGMEWLNKCKNSCSSVPDPTSLETVVSYKNFIISGGLKGDSPPPSPSPSSIPSPKNNTIAIISIILSVLIIFYAIYLLII